MDLNTSLYAESTKAVVDNAQRNGLVWRLLPATISGSSGSVVSVILDGDEQPTQAQSLIGPLGVDTRVMVLVIPPQGNYVIGYYGVAPTLRIVDRVDSLSNTSAITAETVTLTGNQMTFSNGRAYRVIWSQRLDHSAAQIASVRVRQTSISGTQLIFWQAQVTAVVGNNYYSEAVIKRIAGSDLVDNLVLTLAASAGNVVARGAADTVRYMEVWDCGPASGFPSAIAI